MGVPIVILGAVFGSAIVAATPTSVVTTMSVVSDERQVLGIGRVHDAVGPVHQGDDVGVGQLELQSRLGGHRRCVAVVVGDGH